jgi:hypothetical protein
VLLVIGSPLVITVPVLLAIGSPLVITEPAVVITGLDPVIRRGTHRARVDGSAEARP